MIRQIWVVTFLGFHFMGTDLKNFPTWSSMRTRKLRGWNELTGFGNKMRVSIQQSQTLLCYFLESPVTSHYFRRDSCSVWAPAYLELLSGGCVRTFEMIDGI